MRKMTVKCFVYFGVFSVVNWERVILSIVYYLEWDFIEIYSFALKSIDSIVEILELFRYSIRFSTSKYSQ